MNFSVNTFKATQLASQIIGHVNLQMQQAGSLDESPNDQASGQPGEVLLDQADSFVQLSYNTETGASKGFTCKANQNLVNEAGQVVVAAGTETSHSVNGDKQTFRLEGPAANGTEKHEVTVDNAAGTVHYSDGANTAQMTLDELSAGEAGAVLIQKLRAQMGQTAQADESPADQAAGEFGKIALDDEASTIALSCDALGNPLSFSSKAKQTLVNDQGMILVPEGMETIYQRDGQMETFRQDVPTPEGVIRQQLIMDNAQQTLDFQQYILTA